ncbi:MAG: ABC-type glycerol-3-phosphate transport system substrate-binding protein [Candidatus Promineifilaceae bacterium]|jgi:ABC-type glycerol-3-phosphate transport system substrate-binding protein
MTYFLFSQTRSQLLLLMLILLASVVACEFQATELAPGTDDGGLQPTQAAQVPTPVNTPEPSVIELPENNEDLPREATRALTAWVLPQFEIEAESPAGNIIKNQFSTFDANHPEIQLIVEHKSMKGQGGAIDYFSTASNVAPNVLPDLMLVPHSVLPELVAQGIIYPLDDLLASADIQDFFPVADQLVTIDGRRYGYPYALSGLTHAAYNTAIYSGTLPSRLEQIVETTLKPAFPAAGLKGAALLLQLYIDEGGQFYDEEGNLAFESTPMLVALRRIQALRDSGAISDSIKSLSTHDEMWIQYKSGSSSLIFTNYNRFSTEYRQLPDLGFSQFPGSIGTLTPMVDGWVWVISSADPARQALATELLSWMANGPNMGEWTFASQMLPARESAINRWPQDEYTQFLNAELERATVKPELLNSNVGEILQGAMQTLFATTNPPVQDIAENAVKAINMK